MLLQFKLQRPAVIFFILRWIIENGYEMNPVAQHYFLMKSWVCQQVHPSVHMRLWTHWSRGGIRRKNGSAVMQRIIWYHPKSSSISQCLIIISDSHDDLLYLHESWGPSFHLEEPQIQLDSDIHRYIYTYMHILFPRLFWRISKFRPETSIGLTRWAPTSYTSSLQKPYTLPDKWRLLFFKIPPKNQPSGVFFRPPTERTGFAERLKSERFVPTPGFHASFGSVVWGGGKFGGGRRSPNRGTSMAQEVTFRAPRRPFNIVLENKRPLDLLSNMALDIYHTWAANHHKYILPDCVALDFCCCCCCDKFVSS